MICKAKQAGHKVSILHGTCRIFAQTERTKQLVVNSSSRKELHESAEGNLEPKVTASQQKTTVQEDLARQEHIELTPRRTVKEKEVAKRAQDTELEDFDTLRRKAGDHCLCRTNNVRSPDRVAQCVGSGNVQCVCTDLSLARERWAVCVSSQFVDPARLALVVTLVQSSRASKKTQRGSR